MQVRGVQLMPRVTLHGMIPVYVVIDTDAGEVAKVVASDEEFVYVGGRSTYRAPNGPEKLTSMRATYTNELPIAYTENGEDLDRLAHKADLERALEIAENIDSGWPAWDWSF